MSSPGAEPRRDEARRLWPNTSLTIKALAARVGVSKRTIQRWARAEGWTGRTIAVTSKTRKIEAADKSASKPQPGSRPRKLLVKRLYRILNHNVQVMERRMSDDNSSGNADAERDMRALGTAVRTAEKLKELETEHTKRDNAPGDGRSIITPDEEERIRKRVVEHILKLRERKRRETGAG